MIKKSITIVLIVFLINLIISSCCTDTYSIIGVEFSAAKLISDNSDDFYKYYSKTDTLDGQIVFRIQRLGEYISSFLITQNYCYARSCKNVDQNKLLDSTYVITTNRSIVVDGHPVPQGENWWKNSSIKKYIQYFENANQDLIFEFNDDFVSNSQIENGDYRFYFECKSDDYKIFRDSVDVVINLN